MWSVRFMFLPIVQEILECLDSKVDAVALLLAGGPIQLGSNEGLTEESNHSDLAVGD